MTPVQKLETSFAYFLHVQGLSLRTRAGEAMLDSMHLSAELIAGILSHLPACSLARVAGVSKAVFCPSPLLRPYVPLMLLSHELLLITSPPVHS